MVAAALALAILAVVSAAPTPRAPTANYYKPTSSKSLCLTGFDGGKASVDGCGSAPGAQNFQLSAGQLKLTSGGYDLCLTPVDIKNGGRVVGKLCDATNGNSGGVGMWTPGPNDTLRWGDYCLDNEMGLNESGNLVQLWKCSSYNNPNQRWAKEPAPELPWY